MLILKRTLKVIQAVSAAWGHQQKCKHLNSICRHKRVFSRFTLVHKHWNVILHHLCGTCYCRGCRTFWQNRVRTSLRTHNWARCFSSKIWFFVTIFSFDGTTEDTPHRRTNFPGWRQESRYLVLRQSSLISDVTQEWQNCHCLLFITASIDSNDWLLWKVSFLLRDPENQNQHFLIQKKWRLTVNTTSQVEMLPVPLWGTETGREGIGCENSPPVFLDWFAFSKLKIVQLYSNVSVYWMLVWKRICQSRNSGTENDKNRSYFSFNHL